MNDLGPPSPTGHPPGGRPSDRDDAVGGDGHAREEGGPSDGDGRARGEGGPVEVEGGGPGHGGASGVPAGNSLPDGSVTLIGHHQARHWRESTITDDDLADRGGVFFAAVEMTRMPMLLTNPRLPDNPIVFANKAFFDLTGYEESEVLGRNCRFLQGPRTDRDHVRALRDAVEAHQPISLEILNYKRDGSPFWNAVFVGPVTSPDGELLYFFASQLDVTRRRESEDSARQAQKMEAVGQLTAGLAHDFNNLLQVISGNQEQLLKRVEEPDLQRRIRNAQAATDRATKLTGQLLAFARKTRLDPKPVDLSEAVLSFAELLESTLGRQVELQLNLRRRLPRCFVDRTYLETALLNIVVNARDALPDGGTVVIETSRIEVGEDATRELAPGEYVALSVTDDGTGMSPSVAARAVEPFFTTKGQGKGTGLGLAMVHGFLQQSRGRLEIRSDMGRGTTVRMVLPVHHAPPDADADLEVPAPRPEAMPVRPGATILVVEDSEEVLALARENLLEMGYKVLSAVDGQEALEVLDRVGNRIDLLFTDLVMPGSINGLVLAEEMRRRAPEVPILLTTGYNEDLAQSEKAPGMDVLGKPYRRSELADRVRGALAGSGRPGPRRLASEFGPAEE